MGASELSRNSSGEKNLYLVARAKLQPIVLNKMYLLNGPNSRNSSGEKKTYLVARAKLQPIVLNKMYLLNGPNFKNGHPPDHFLDTFESKIPYP